MSAEMSKTMCLLLVVFVTVMVMGVAMAQEAPNNLNAALEYLEGLDRYYSAKARPRFVVPLDYLHYETITFK